jgi:quercetin dioxygenase-like cupin family protein
MKKLFCGLFLAVIVAVGVASIASADTMSSGATTGAAMTPTIITADQLKWTPCQGLNGCNMAVVWGDPNNKTGALYVVRLRLDDGINVPVHWHTDSERVTVLSGTLLFAAGHKIDQSKTAALGPGSFVFIPANMHHYAIAKGETIVQIAGNGPMTMNLMK